MFYAVLYSKSTVNSSSVLELSVPVTDAVAVVAGSATGFADFKTV